MMHLGKGGNDAVGESNLNRAAQLSLRSSLVSCVLCLCSYIGVITMFRYATGP